MTPDEHTYRRLVEPHRAELHAHCYRMLGSLQDADDALQEALLRAWRGLPRFEGRSSLRSWLYTIATNICLRAIERRREIANEYVAAWERGDVDAVVAMLAEDATMTMPPIPTWYGGREAVAAFLRRRPLAGDARWRLVRVRANRQLAFGHYIWDGEIGRFAPHGVNVLTLQGARIGEITAFLTPQLVRRFGLPSAVTSSRRAPS